MASSDVQSETSGTSLIDSGPSSPADTVLGDSGYGMSPLDLMFEGVGPLSDSAGIDVGSEAVSTCSGPEDCGPGEYCDLKNGNCVYDCHIPAANDCPQWTLCDSVFGCSECDHLCYAMNHECPEPFTCNLEQQCCWVADCADPAGTGCAEGLVCNEETHYCEEPEAP